MFKGDTAPDGGDCYLGSFEAAARILAVEPIALRLQSEGETDAAITSLGREQVVADAFIAAHLRRSFRGPADSHGRAPGTDARRPARTESADVLPMARVHFGSPG